MLELDSLVSATLTRKTANTYAVLHCHIFFLQEKKLYKRVSNKLVLSVKLALYKAFTFAIFSTS